MEGKKERLDRVLVLNCAGSRKQVGQLIRSGQVTVNDLVVRRPEQKVDPDCDRICVKGTQLPMGRYLYIMMNKPQGVISSTDGRKTAEKTVIDILPAEMKRKGLFPAGRLDKNTTGFMLITDDGAFAHDILSPKKHISKTYIAELDKPFPESAVEKFARGIEIGGEICMPAALSAENESRTLARVVIRQGKYHQVKRMFAALGCEVVSLKRICMGDLPLDEKLVPGECKYLSDEEISKIKNMQKL